MHDKNTDLRLAVCLLAFGAALLMAQTPTGLPLTATTNAVTAAVGASKIQFASTTFEFGRVPAGTVVWAMFVLTNTGTAPLEITAVRPGCGCTTAGNWDRRVEPGHSTILPLQLNTANFVGPINKNAMVTCNDPGRSMVMLQIKGEVWKQVDVQPSIVNFNLTSEQASNEVRTVRVINNTEQDMTLQEPTCGHPSFKATLKVIRLGKEFEIQVTTVPPLELGTVRGTVTAKTSRPDLPAVTFQILATVQPAVTVTPSVVMLPAGSLSGPTQFTVLVRNNCSEPFTVSDPSLTVSNVTVSVNEVQPGRFYNLALTFPAGFQLPPSELGQLSIKTSHPKIPLIQVPIRMSVPAQPTTSPSAVPQ